MTSKVDINDNIEDVTIKFLFVKRWVYLDPIDKEKFDGNPQEGSVVLTAYNNKTKSYRIVLKENPIDAMLIDDLHNKEEMKGYLCDFDEISLDNILDFNLNLEDLEKLERWQKLKTEDLYPAPKLPPMLFFGSIQDYLSKVIDEQKNEDAERVAKTVDRLDNLLKINSIQFEIVEALVDYLCEINLLRTDDESDFLALDKKHGLGVNISKAVEHIKIYSGSDRRTNKSVEDLFYSVEYLITELERRKLHNLPDGK